MISFRSKISLGIAAGAAVFIAAYSFWYMRQPADGGDAVTQTSFENDEDIDIYTEVLSVPSDFRYVLRELDGRIAVFDAYSDAFLFDTGITLQALPHELIVDIGAGLYLTDETDLYDFIENYSS